MLGKESGDNVNGCGLGSSFSIPPKGMRFIRCEA